MVSFPFVYVNVFQHGLVLTKWKIKASFVTMHDTASTPRSQSPDSNFANLDSLGNHIYLEKQDKLRDLGINLQTSQVMSTDTLL